MEETVGAAKGERTGNRLGYRAGYFGRTLVTRVGKLELRVPQDRQGRFRTEVFERYQRSLDLACRCALNSVRAPTSLAAWLRGRAETGSRASVEARRPISRGTASDN